jgi:hypothetical protein
MDYFARGPRGEDHEAGAAIQVGVKAGPDAEEARWSLVLTLFFRLVAFVWIAQGLEQWRRLIAPAAGSFLDMTGATLAATFFFSVMDLVAAVGLWLVAPWGGVVWLLTLLAQIFVASVKPGFFLLGVWTRPIDGLLLALYLALSWRANQAFGEHGPAGRLIEAIGVFARARRGKGEEDGKDAGKPGN